MRILVSASLALALLSTPGFAADTAKPAKDKKICKRGAEGSTGSNLRRSSTVCRTASEWKEFDFYTQKTLRDAQESSGQGTSSTASGPNPGAVPN
jgi:hypothetical protein